jgi:hypothetical protein
VNVHHSQSTLDALVGPVNASAAVTVVVRNGKRWCRRHSGLTHPLFR